MGKTTTQEARRQKANKVKNVLLKIPVSIYLLKSVAWIPIQIFYVDSHFENYTTTRTLTFSMGHLWLLVIVIMSDGSKNTIVKVAN